MSEIELLQEISGKLDTIIESLKVLLSTYLLFKMIQIGKASYSMWKGGYKK